MLYPKGALTSTWYGMVRAYAESPQQEASKYEIRESGFCGLTEGRKWDQIDWPTMHRRVRRLQTRIAKATRDQNWRRVKALQRFLVNSFSAKALAAKRVSENDGKRTPGVDGEISCFAERLTLIVSRTLSKNVFTSALYTHVATETLSKVLSPLEPPKPE